MARTVFVDTTGYPSLDFDLPAAARASRADPSRGRLRRADRACRVALPRRGLAVHELAVQAISNGPLVALLLSVAFALGAWRAAIVLRPIAALRAGIVGAGAAVAVFAVTPSVSDPTTLAVAVVLPPSVQAGYVLALLAAPLFMAAVVLAAFSLGRHATSDWPERRPLLPADTR